MSRSFIHDDFLLETRAASRLYHEYAEGLPIIDYHCHLPPREIAEDKHWDNIAQVWLNGDHYKWRAMRSNGIDERFCTGNASDREKFEQFAATMPYLLRNPIYHWSQLELARFFGVYELLSPKTADTVWNQTAEVLQGGLSARQCMTRSRVEVVCTTDDPADDLAFHTQIRADKSFAVKVLPTWRPDKAMAIENPANWNAWIAKLEAASGLCIAKYAELLSALRKRHAFFHEQGCRLSDYGMETVHFAPASESEVAAIFDLVRSGKSADNDQTAKFRSAMLLECARMDAQSRWTRQLHLGVIRNNNSAMFAKVGPDAGYDSISDCSYGSALCRHLDTLSGEGNLGKTILYHLHPKDFEMLATMAGNFQDGITPGKMQLGSAWWFLDQKSGMEHQLEAISQLGVLRRFVGMLTDSRSFLSYTRHEYFRRILCNLLGKEMENGLLPNDFELIGAMVREISCDNARDYFGF